MASEVVRDAKKLRRKMDKKTGIMLHKFRPLYTILFALLLFCPILYAGPDSIVYNQDWVMGAWAGTILLFILTIAVDAINYTCLTETEIVIVNHAHEIRIPWNQIKVIAIYYPTIFHRILNVGVALIVHRRGTAFSTKARRINKIRIEYFKHGMVNNDE